jgi:lysyl-tRNA synthetase class 1
VPRDAPRPELLSANLGRSICDVPDPWGCHDSYASHHIAQLERDLPAVGIRPRFIRQHERYRAGAYAEGIRHALVLTETIRTILNDARRQHGARSLLGDDWLPLSGFCDACGGDDLTFSWDGEWSVGVSCSACGHENTVDLRIDWPMRWAHERVCFEPGGKDHSSAGGSYDTAKKIVAEVYGWRAPEYVGYDFVSAKGQGGKFSSSKGGVITLADCLEVYEPMVLRWLFASYRPNTEFQISFDLDVIKIYEDFDRALRLAHEADDGSSKDKKRQVARRTMELAAVEPTHIVPGSTPPQAVPFRQLSMLLQTFDGDVERTRAHLRGQGILRTQADDEALTTRAGCVWRWIEDYAPDEFRYRVRTEPVSLHVASEAAAGLRVIVDALERVPANDEKALGSELRALGEIPGLELKTFYPVVYELLVGRDHGPKLTTLLATIGPKRAVPLLAPTLQASDRPTDRPGPI